MNGKVLSFNLKTTPSREHVKNWLVNNCDSWPVSMVNDISGDMFYGWRFIRSTDGLVYFANCVDAGISEHEINAVTKRI